MALATGEKTNKYSFNTIKGTDTAGYTSINDVITSIDTEISDHFIGMIILVASGWVSPKAKDNSDMWEDYTTGNGYTNVPAPPNIYHKYVIRI
jgi:hypothetical protein